MGRNVVTSSQTPADHSGGVHLKAHGHVLFVGQKANVALAASMLALR